MKNTFVRECHMNKKKSFLNNDIEDIFYFVQERLLENCEK